MRKKTTKAEFRQFCEEVDRLTLALNLRDWDIQVRHDEWHLGKFKLESKYAVTELKADQRWAYITMNRDYVNIAFNPVRVAKHEMAHVFLATLNYLGSCRWADGSELDLEDERMAVVLEKVL